MLSTVAKHIISPYSKTKLSVEMLELCKQTSTAIKSLQSHVSKCRGFLVVRERLGNVLIIPVPTRWPPTFTMVKSYMENQEIIGDVLNEFAPECYSMHLTLLEKYGQHFSAYVNVVQPISFFITMFEVC